MDRSGSIYLDDAERFLRVPKGEDVTYDRDPLDFVIKLNEIEQPIQRLYQFLYSYFNIDDGSLNLESQFVRTMTLAGFLGGASYGALVNTEMIRSRFIRKHNASVFENKYDAQRKYKDYLITRIGSRALKAGIKCGLVVTSAGFISFGSIAYRGELYAPDWLIGFTTLGIASRFSLGPRAWLVGGGAGLTIGALSFGCAKFTEFLTGYTSSQLAYLNYTNWLEGRKRKYEKIRTRQKLHIAEKYQDMEEGEPIG